VLMPAQRVRELHAVRGASAEGAPDTTKFRTTEKDRLTGDTIVAWFDTIPVKDTAHKPRIRQLVAIGSKASPAASLQHLPPRDSSLCRPDIVYVRGRLITVDFDTAKVSRVKVTDEDKSGGLYLEAKPDSASRCRPALAALPAPSDGSAADTVRRPPASPTPSAPPPAPTSTAPVLPAPTSPAPAPKRP